MLKVNKKIDLKRKKMISTPLMMEKPVNSPMVPPMRLSWASVLIFLSRSMLSKVDDSNLISTSWRVDWCCSDPDFIIHRKVVFRFLDIRITEIRSGSRSIKNKMFDIVLFESLILSYQRLNCVQRFCPLGNVSIDPIAACWTTKRKSGFVGYAIPALDVAL